MPRWSARTLLACLVLACLLPGIIGAAALFRYEYRRGLAQIERDALQTTRALVQAVDSQLLRARASAQALGTSKYLAERDFAGFHRQARRLLQETGIGAFIAVLDGTGRNVVNTLRPFGEPLPPHGNPEDLGRVVATGQPLISNVYIGSISKRPRISIYAPVTEGSRVIYAVNIGLDSSELDNLLLAQRLPPHWLVSIVDNTGTIAARNRTPAQFVGQKAPPDILERITAAAEGSLQSRSKEGIASLVVFSRSPVTGWRVVSAIPRRSLEAPLQRSLRLVGLGLALLFGFGLGLAAFMGKRIARSIQVLAGAAFRLEAGQDTPPPRVYLKEAAEAARAIGEAAALLQERTAALQKSEQRLALALRAGGTAVWEMDVATSRLLPADDLLYAMLGYAPGDLTLSAEWISLVHDEDRAGLPEMIDEVIQGRRDSYRAELRLRARDGSWRWILSQAVAAERDAGGRALRLVGTHTDITLRKAAEAEIRRLNGELEERVRRRTAELQRSNEALLESNSELQRFAHAAAHDLQTPLRSIAGFAQLLQQEIHGCLDERADEWLTLVIDNTKRLQVLIQELLAYARLDGRARPFEAVDMDGVFGEVLANLSPWLDDMGAEVSCGPLPQVLADRTQMAQLLQNLIENGIKYNRSRPPRVGISAEGRGGEWVFAVADNGIGIDPRYHRRIFEIFRRLHSYGDIPGTGIGLAICQRIVERHGGRLWLESAAGQGSVFYFSLPARAAATAPAGG